MNATTTTQTERKYTTEKLAQMLEAHAAWLRGDADGQCFSAEYGANLGRANLRGADLSGADLSRANLIRANLIRADLHGTSLDPEIHSLQRRFCRECPPLRTGGRIVYRTARSAHIGNTVYEPGRTYVAPHLSFSAETECHPGIYAGSWQWMKEYYGGRELVRCYVRDGDWTITAKGAIRCKRLRVLGAA